MLREFLTEDRDELVIDLYLGESRVSGESRQKVWSATPGAEGSHSENPSSAPRSRCGEIRTVWTR